MKLLNQYNYAKMKENLSFFNSQDILGELFPCHPNDNVCGGSFRAFLLVHRAGPLVGMMVAPKRNVHFVLLYIYA